MRPTISDFPFLYVPTEKPKKIENQPRQWNSDTLDLWILY